jgi:60 kDa SS-A/Ro ribonucleoprotein
MSVFNTESVGTVTTNFAGGKAYKVNPKFELVSILLTSMLKDGFYRTANDTLARLKELMKECDPLFVAKAAVFARREYGMRSITHVAGGELAKMAKGQTWTKRFYKRLFKRPDDMMETLAYYVSQYGKRPIPNSLKKGIALSMAEYNEYQLAKYRGEGKSIKMIDLVNLCHPKNTPAIKKLVQGKLKSTQTWEAKLTQAGKSAVGETVEEKEESKAELKAEAWKELIENKTIGYFALLRNLKNIEEQAPNLIDKACDLLVSRESIKKSLVLPFQFMKAIPMVKDRRLTLAVAQAIEISLDNCPKLPGKSLICVDMSGSMEGQNFDIAKLFGSVLYKTNDADFVVFDTAAYILRLIPTDSLAGMQAQIPCKRGGTDFSVIFKGLKRVYQRIIILSDMQGWVGGGGIANDWRNYRKNVNPEAFLYSIDLAALGTLQTPEANTFLMSGFSEKIFDTMKALEEDRNALIKRIEAEVI